MDSKVQERFERLVQLAQKIEKCKNDYDQHIKAIAEFGHGYMLLTSVDRKFILTFENGVIDYNNKETGKTESGKQLLDITKNVLINHVLTPLVRNKRVFYKSESDVFVFINCFMYVCSLDSGRLGEPLFYINCSRNRFYMTDGEDQSINTDDIPLDTQKDREIKEIADAVRGLVDTVNPAISTDVKEKTVKKISQDADNPADSTHPPIASTNNRQDIAKKTTSGAIDPAVSSPSAATNKSFTLGNGKYMIGAALLVVAGLLAHKYLSTSSQDEDDKSETEEDETTKKTLAVATQSV
jgi:hypothetical protein